jgi:hypothetical protein
LWHHFSDLGGAERRRCQSQMPAGGARKRNRIVLPRVIALVIAGRVKMKKIFVTLAATSSLALGACQSPAADKVEDQAEAKAEVIDDQADAMPEGAAKEAMEQKADVVEEQGEEKANAMDDNGEIAPSESGVGDTQKK